MHLRLGLVKIFVSYSRRDANDFARRINIRFRDEDDYDVFTDVNNIPVGSNWSDTITNNIGQCDVFVIIVTHGALDSKEVEKEVLQAQNNQKTVVPCIHQDVNEREIGYAGIKWNLSRLQGIEFKSEDELVRSLFAKIERIKSSVTERFKTPSQIDLHQEKSEENGLPEWADNELKNANFQILDPINRTGYFLDINEQSKKADIQLYESLSDGRTLIEEIDLVNDLKVSELMKGFVYEYKIKISKAKLSDQLCELLKTKYQIDMDEIFKFDLESAQMMDVESGFDPNKRDKSKDK